jgi:hypothetical protein
VVIPHIKKIGGQHLWLLTREILQSWDENICDNFASDEMERHFQGDSATVLHLLNFHMMELLVVLIAIY